MSDRLSIRLAVLEERPALEDLHRRAAMANQGDREALLAMTEPFHVSPAAIEEERVFVAERHHKLLGFATVIKRAETHCEMTALFVDPDAWRGGIGKLLVTRCCNYTKEQGGQKLSVIGNPHAEQFYEACGFEKQGTVETELGTGLLLELEVSQLL